MTGALGAEARQSRSLTVRYDPPVAFHPRNLNEGETVGLDLRPHWWQFAGPASALVAALVLLGLSLLVVDGLVILDYLAGALVLVAVIWLLSVYFDWRSTVFVVTDRRLIYSSGVLSKSGVEIPIDRVNNVIFNQTLFERVIGSGDLVIESAGESGQQRFSNVRNPRMIQNAINRAMEEFDQERRTPITQDSVPDQIAKLAELRDNGVISEEEFEAKKSDLLDRM